MQRNDEIDRRHDRLALRLAATWVVLQILLPLAFGLFARHRPTVFAWQMFSRAADRVEFEVALADGSSLVLRPADIVLKDRADIPLAELLPPVLCERPGALAVTTVTPAGRTRSPCD